MVDLKGLMGDNSDNLPGIKGVGEKTALKLLSKYGTMESVLENAENEKGALRQKLLDGAESARMSYELGTINTDAPVSESVEDCRFKPALLANGTAELTKLELRAVLKRVRELAGTQNQNAANMPETNGKMLPNLISAMSKVMKSCGPALIRFCNALRLRSIFVNRVSRSLQ